MNWQFFLEVLIGGLLAGVMYSLVALGFVLIYKASGVFNFAQGAMVFFAALTFVGAGRAAACNFWVAFALTLGVMVVLGIAIERIVLRPLVNQPQITLFMATIGLTFVLEGLAQLLWGAQRARPRARHPGRADRSGCRTREHQHQPVRPVRRGRRRRCWSRRWRCSSRRTRIGRALRAVADDHQAALAVGIPLQQIWAHRLGGRRASSRWSPGLHVGRAQRRAVRADVHRAEGAAGADPRRLRRRSPAPSSAG